MPETFTLNSAIERFEDLVRDRFDELRRKAGAGLSIRGGFAGDGGKFCLKSPRSYPAHGNRTGRVKVQNLTHPCPECDLAGKDSPALLLGNMRKEGLCYQVAELRRKPFERLMHELFGTLPNCVLRLAEPKIFVEKPVRN